MVTFAVWALAMGAIGAILDQTARVKPDGSKPAGFGLGLVHGALMPLALPRIAVGGDVAIYALNNSGRPYNLGYTLGVNLCGAAFFGFSFWWYSRAWQRARASMERVST